MISTSSMITQDLLSDLAQCRPQMLETRGRIGLAGRSPTLDIAVELPNAALGPILSGIPVKFPAAGRIRASEGFFAPNRAATNVLPAEAMLPPHLIPSSVARSTTVSRAMALCK